MKKIIYPALIAGAALLTACTGKTEPQADLKNEVDTLSYALGVANSPTEAEIKNYLMQAGSDSAYVDAFFKGLKDGLHASDDKKELAYQMGMQSGMQMKTRMFTGIEQQVFANDSTKHLSTKQFLAGLLDSHAGKTGLKVAGQPATRETIQPILSEVMGRMTESANAKVFAEAKKQNEDYMAKVAKEAGVKALSGGVYYKEIKAGTGPAPKATDRVEVSYEGRLINGVVFDSSREQTVVFGCNEVIKGWTTALTNMKEGAEWEVYIPWQQAYGKQQQGPIPPYSALIFKIKLVKVNPSGK